MTSSTHAPRHTAGTRHSPRVRAVPLRAVLLGVAAGSRASLGVGAPVLRAGARGPVRAGTLLTVAGELVGDKLPQTPSRLDPPGPQSRLLSGGLGGAALARGAGRGPGGVLLAVAAGVAGAAAGTWGGAAWRAWSAGRRPDWQGALVEDATAITLAALACRRSR